MASLNKLHQPWHMRSLCPAHTFLVKTKIPRTAVTWLSCSLDHGAEVGLVGKLHHPKTEYAKAAHCFCASNPTRNLHCYEHGCFTRDTYDVRKREEGVKNPNPLGSHSTHRSTGDITAGIARRNWKLEGPVITTWWRNREGSSAEVSISWSTGAVCKNDWTAVSRKFSVQTEHSPEPIQCVYQLCQGEGQQRDRRTAGTGTFNQDENTKGMCWF